ncbi:hypothetical protein QQ045_018005 [Rhodiola kirilowii]
MKRWPNFLEHWTRLHKRSSEAGFLPMVKSNTVPDVEPLHPASRASAGTKMTAATTRETIMEKEKSRFFMMGKKLDALLKRSSLKPSKFKPLVKLAIHRLAVLKNQRQVRCNIAKSDVVEILKLGLHDRALLRVEHVIMEQNMLHVFLMLEAYCNLFFMTIFRIFFSKLSCPDELKGAISSLLYAASRCGDGEFPELQEIRSVFTSHYGKEFAARAIELRNNCGVSTTLIQKLMPSLESRMSVLKQIADEKGITLQLGESSFGKQANTGQTASHLASQDAENGRVVDRERYFGSGKANKYENAAEAAQTAFESAAYAAHAARAAVELSRGDSHDSEGSNSPYPRRRKLSGNAMFGTQIKDNDPVHMETRRTEKAVASLKRSGLITSDSTETLMDSDAVDTPKQESQTIYVKYHAYRMEHNSASSDPLMVNKTAAFGETGSKASSFAEGAKKASSS